MVWNTKVPILLFWLPFSGHLPVISLGSVSSSLLHKRRRQGQSGCLVALDVNSQSPPEPDRSETGTKEKVSPKLAAGCKRQAYNGRVVRAAVALLSSDQEMERVRPLPPRIQCGHLRSAVRSVFPDHLTQVQELSIKTAQKLESEPCSFCASGKEEILRKYKEERFAPTEPAKPEHLSRFIDALRCIVNEGWNLGDVPYIPTGHATLFHSRREGGSWRSEPFASHCRAELVYSSGKPRVVTMYSSHVARVLSPLHQRLYSSLRRGGTWLLVGSPTNEKVKHLNGDGPYVSVDYRQATDMIKAEYVDAAVRVLEEKSVGLTDEEVRCLRVVAELRFDDRGPCAVRGQPMGSLMSFPLLCLINKACVDLALVDLLDQGKIPVKKFSGHRCLINGDDLLYREFDDSLDIREGILRHGHAVGLVLNMEKTLVSPEVAEINSTVFVNGERRKKTNVAVLRTDSEVADVIGFLADSVVKRANFKALLRSWAPCLAKQVRKLQGPVPPSFYSALWSVRDALTVAPLDRPTTCNPFPIVSKPAGYDLSRGDEVRYISERVARLMRSGYIPEKSVGWSTGRRVKLTIQQALRKDKPCMEDTILKVLADAWERVRKEKLWLEDDALPLLTTWAWDERSKIDIMVDALKAFKQKKRLACATPDAGTFPGVVVTTSHEMFTSDYVEL